MKKELKEEIKEEKKEANIDNCLSKETAFDIFWKEYPKKRSKGDAYKAFMQLKDLKELFPKIINAIQNQKRSEDWRKEAGKYIPYPATWLRHQCWNDEPDTGVDDFLSMFGNDPYKEFE